MIIGDIRLFLRSEPVSFSHTTFYIGCFGDELELSPVTCELSRMLGELSRKVGELSGWLSRNEDEEV